MTTKFTNEQLSTWADKLIEETYSDIEISRTDAHAESYRAQLALLEMARTALKDAPAHEATDWQVDEAVARMEGEGDMVVVPRGVLGAASGAIRHPGHEAGVTLGPLRHYSFRKQPAPEVPSAMTPEMMRAVQLNSELGAYVAANLSGAYGLFAEFWKVACLAAGKSPAITDEARQIRDLVMMVKVLARTVRKYNAGSQQAKDFLAYLERECLISSTDCLRLGAKDPE